jgi:hypothetical protein
MYLVYQFFPSYVDPISNSVRTNVWVVSSSCSLLSDASAQLARFVSSGVDPNYLQQLTDSQAAPTGIPSP